MIRFPDSEIVNQSLERYFDFYHFNNGGYNDKSFTVKFWGPLKLTIPNTKGRIKAVKLHDIHHIVTEYEANLKGEAEIGAWELAAGCGKYPAAWVLNAGSVAYGFLIWPKKIYKAFIWGSQCDSLYHHKIYKEYNSDILNTSVGTLREQLHTNHNKSKVRLRSVLSFLATVFVIYGSILSSALLGLIFLIFLIHQV